MGVSHVMSFDLNLYFQGRSAFGGRYPKRWHRLIYVVYDDDNDDDDAADDGDDDDEDNTECSGW